MIEEVGQVPSPGGRHCSWGQCSWLDSCCCLLPSRPRSTWRSPRSRINARVASGCQPVAEPDSSLLSNIIQTPRQPYDALDVRILASCFDAPGKSAQPECPDIARGASKGMRLARKCCEVATGRQSLERHDLSLDLIEE